MVSTKFSPEMPMALFVTSSITSPMRSSFKSRSPASMDSIQVSSYMAYFMEETSS
jgi:hypothetical protein